MKHPKKIMNIQGLKCISCNKEFDQNELDYTCSSCGANLDVIYDFEKIKKELTKKDLLASHENSIFRYLPLLPVHNNTPRPLAPVGMTPLVRSKRTEQKFGLKEVYFKNDGMNPSASFKDRASAMGMMKALEKNKKIITGASTGNAASSLACLTASTDLETIIFVPQTAPQAKIAQLLVFGARVFTVKGTYDDAFDLCMQATKEWGWYNRNTGINPYLSEGKKTCSLEVAEQLSWSVPDYLLVSVGDGCIIGGIHKGFKDLYALGFIDKIPKLVAVQAQGSASIFKTLEKMSQNSSLSSSDNSSKNSSDNSFKNSSDNSFKNSFQEKTKLVSVKADTVADSISVDLPRDGYKAIRAVTETNGFAITVTDAEILKAIPDLARDCSIFAEPAGAAAYAGLKKAVQTGLIEKNARVTGIITGNGLKDISSAMKSVSDPTPISSGNKGFEELKTIFTQ